MYRGWLFFINLLFHEKLFASQFQVFILFHQLLFFNFVHESMKTDNQGALPHSGII